MDVTLLIRSKAEGSSREVKCAIGEGLVVGRGAEEGILLDGPDLSREHILLTTDGTHIYVTDLSSNGTWVNGARLKRTVKTRLRNDDLIELPGYTLSLKHDEEQPEEVPAPAPAPKPQPVLASVPMATYAPQPAKPSGRLAPVFGFIGSFSFGEKFCVLVGLAGLALLYVYMA